MSSRITRSRAAAAGHMIPPVIVATVAETTPHNIIYDMPPAIPIEDVLEPVAPPAISIPPHKVFVTISKDTTDSESAEIDFRDHNMYICENYMDVYNKPTTISKVVEMNQIQKWLRLWFKTAQLDQHNVWKSIEVNFALLPPMMTRRESLTDERIDLLVSHIMESIAILYELEA